METQTRLQPTVQVEPMTSEFAVTLGGLIELPLNAAPKTFFDGLLEHVLEYVEKHGAVAGLEMSYKEYDATGKISLVDSSIKSVQPSVRLVNLAQHYLEIVDSGDETRQGEERTRAHEALMDAMEAERIPFNARWEARWIARWLLSGEQVSDGKQTTIMFAKTPVRYDKGEYDPVRDGVVELSSFPFQNEDDERKRAERFIPVLVTIEPLHDYEGATYERNK